MFVMGYTGSQLVFIRLEQPIVAPRSLFRPICNVRKSTGEPARRIRSPQQKQNGALICTILRLVPRQLLMISDLDDQTNPRKQGSKRLGRVVVQ
jgi:hypothetical protein